MPTAPSDESRNSASDLLPSRAALLLLSLGAGLVCHLPLAAGGETATISRPAFQPAAKATPAPAPKPPLYNKKWGKLEGNAVWYDVPVNSLAYRRAGKGELTAAHNRLPLGTMVRVTHLANKKSVVVRITDRGITSRRALIDLCKEAAVQLDMIKEGSARVRLEILPDDRRITGPSDSNTTRAHP